MSLFIFGIYLEATLHCLEVKSKNINCVEETVECFLDDDIQWCKSVIK